jgi:putative molybdopterin biosynthesis protein
VTSTRQRPGTETGLPTAPERDQSPGAVEHGRADADAVPAEPVGEAFRTWVRACARAGWTAVGGTETVAVISARGRVTAEPVRARWPVPAYRAAAMDGIAVTTAGIDAEIGAGGATAADPAVIRLSPEQFDHIDTGDPVPEDRDAVVMRELVTFTPGGAAELSGPAVAGRHIRPVGEDIEAGAIVLPAGHRVRPADAAALAAAGHVSILVRRQPKVTILPTGDEIRPVGATLAPGQILDTNSIMLAGLAEEAGCVTETLPIVPDVPDRIAASVAAAASRADLVLVIAGSSAGRDDHTSSVIRQLGRVAVHGVAMRPGHPVVLGVLGGSEDDPDSPALSGIGLENNVEDGAVEPRATLLPVRPGAPAVPVVGIPGYPASAERAFTCFVRPMLRRILDTGAAGAVEHGVAARLAGPIGSAEHLDEYVRVRLARVVAPRTGHATLVAVALPRGAGALNTLVQTEAILRIPAGDTGYPAGATVRPVPVEGAAFAAGTTIVTGLRSPATNALADLLGADLPVAAVHWQTLDAHPAVEALADGLCHAAAILVDVAGGLPDEQLAAGLVERLGPITLLEVARVGAQAEMLAVPAAAFDSGAVERLRTALSSMGYRRALRRLPGYSGRGAGHETWHGPTVPPASANPTTSPSVSAADPANGATQCATR